MHTAQPQIKHIQPSRSRASHAQTFFCFFVFFQGEIISLHPVFWCFPPAVAVTCCFLLWCGQETCRLFRIIWTDLHSYFVLQMIFYTTTLLKTHFFIHCCCFAAIVSSSMYDLCSCTLTRWLSKFISLVLDHFCVIKGKPRENCLSKFTFQIF